MANPEIPFIPPEQTLPEITLKVIILSIILAVILAVANTYLALKIGLLTSASIPAAVISMGVLRFFRNSNILENNLVQTAASAGEAVAGGIVYTVPALIIIDYWHHFNYWENVWIALLGGFLGVMFSIPLRRFLMVEPSLKFPEGRAIAEILKARAVGTTGFRNLVLGGAFGAVVELAQTGLKLLSSGIQFWMPVQRTIVGFGIGFSALMIGAGYLVGWDLASSILLGAVLNWFCTIPIVGAIYPVAHSESAQATVQQLWQNKVIFIGIGALVCAGVWTLFAKLGAFLTSFKVTLIKLAEAKQESRLRTEFDIPGKFVLLFTAILAVGLFIYIYEYFPIAELELRSSTSILLMLLILGYLLFVGFISSAITAYFSGMVGVTATPGSAIVIGGMTIAALGLFLILQLAHPNLSNTHLHSAAAIAILISAFITGAAAISNDNMQDLKVGHILGATPWKQQVMLLLGVLIAAIVIPPVMQVLFDVYGIAGHMPRPGMNVAESLPAPPAAMMAVLAQAVFAHDLPWPMVGVGIAIMLALILLTQFSSDRLKRFSVLGIAIGMYLPLSSSIPLVIGGFFAMLASKKVRHMESGLGTLLACGLVAGASLMDVVLAVPFSYYHNPDVLTILPAQLNWLSVVFSVIMTCGLGFWFLALAKTKELT